MVIHVYADFRSVDMHPRRDVAGGAHHPPQDGHEGGTSEGGGNPVGSITVMGRRSHRILNALCSTRDLPQIPGTRTAMTFTGRQEMLAR